MDVLELMCGAAMTKFTEVIRPTRPLERRRRAWSTDQKITILDAAFRRGGSVAAAAHQFGVAPPLIYLWRTRVRDGLMPDVVLPDAGGVASAAAALAGVARSTARAALVPAATASPPSASTPCHAGHPGRNGMCREPRAGGVIEVRLANGRALTVDDSIAPDVLARLVAALDGDARQRPDGGGS